jgi:sec-independent protein translocase protein TatA
MFGIGMPELIVIFVVALVVFGPGKLPDVGKSLGEAIRGFKKAVNEPEKSSSEESEKQPQDGHRS